MPETDFSLPDGTSVVIRPLTPDDASRLIDFHEELSAETVYRRYFAPHPHLSHAEVQHLCGTDGYDRFALVALAEDRIVGVARMERLKPATRAEVAFVLADRFQHRGLGHQLALRLLDAARERGVREVIADTMADNLPMLHLLGDAGYPVTYTRDQGLVRVTCELPAP